MKTGFIALLLLFSSRGLVFSATPAGSLTTFGPGTQISGVRVASGAAVFTGDSIQADQWGALLVLPRGRTVWIGPGAEVRVAAPAQVEIVRGVSRIVANSEPFTLLAADWRLQGKPDATTGTLKADVFRDAAGNVSLNVSRGQVVAQRRDEKIVVLAQAGHPAFLPAALPQPAGRAPSSSGVGRKGTLLAYLGAGAGLALGTTTLATHSDNSSQRAQLAELSAQNAALTAQVNTLITLIQAWINSVQDRKAFADAINDILGRLYTAQAQLAQVQVQINALAAKMIPGQSLSPADQAQLASLMAQQAQLTATIATLAASLQPPFPPWKPCPVVPSPNYPCLP